MKSVINKLIVLSLTSLLFTSCSAIESIFKAGMGVGIFIVIAILAIIVYIISKFSGKK
ncbi:hypothetical protein [Flavobacterium sp.]|jgi:hypothetical protein|uniref:hypothetical protein n=1 Tax=Flavobacterium sp. TaxID=239 RepID=UPI002CB20DE4|nr:hypothetical protein [Flavobacterium sp.]HQA73692.1 hypothetical protein [Flavobacterium sp.]